MSGPSAAQRQKHPDGPCQGYSGSLCINKDNTQPICSICGWDRFSHSPDVRADILRNLAVEPDFIAKLEDVESTVADEHNDI